MTFDVNSYMVFLFVSSRMTGVIFFNPIFGRKNIATIVKVGLSLGLAFSVAHMYMDVSVVDYTAIETVLCVIKEFAIGFTIGYIMHLFLAVFHVGGQIMDLQMGLSMASLYDPTINAQISITGNLLTMMYTMLFFITNSHIMLLAICAKSFNMIPIGLGPINSRIGIFMIELFGYMLLYAVQLALPIIITQTIVEVAVGILMRVVPNINVFVVNLQVKLGVGMIVILSIIPVLVKYLEKLNMVMLERLQDGLTVFM